MTLGGEDAVQYAQETADKLAPVFEEAHNIGLNIPSYKGGWCSGMEYRARSNTVKLNVDTLWNVTQLVGDTGHELGHAALYQNSDFDDLKQDESYNDFLLRGISEGIAQWFENEALRHYGGHGDGTNMVRPIRYRGRKAFNLSIRAGLDTTCAAAEALTGKSLVNEYRIGRQIFRGKTEEERREILHDPETLYHDVKDDYLDADGNWK